jgi:4-amino-4-deoxychorismate lyase
MRLTLDAAGEFEAVAAELPAAAKVWRLGLASARLRSDNPWLTVKSTRRAAYDAARLAMAEGLEEVLFLNERGEVCDGTITTVFFDAGQGLRTPPLRSGLLPGVLRADLLAQGRVQEEVLTGEDLPRVRLWVGNSLRGLCPAIWCS